MLSTSPGLLSLALFSLQAMADLSARANDVDPTLASEKDDCDWAGSFQPLTDMECFSSTFSEALVEGYTVRYGINLAGTGQDPTIWCNDIISAVTQYCALERQVYTNSSSCDVSNPLVAVDTLDGNNGWAPYTAQGVVLEFWMNPANTTDNGNLLSDLSPTMEAQRKTFMLLPDFSYPPNRNIFLGTVLPWSRETKLPDPEYPLNTGTRITPPEHKIRTQAEPGWSAKHLKGTLISPSLDAELPVFSPFSASAAYNKTGSQTFDITCNLKTERFAPSPQYLVDALKDPQVLAQCRKY
ncbi:hypothetical protein LTR27_012979 [Elasticomyces elasticus]|nr:hypothetical protein LTR27_012979 [Elasticomyces elasticus]